MYLVTGGAGFIGSNLVAALAALGARPPEPVRQGDVGGRDQVAVGRRGRADRAHVQHGVDRAGGVRPEILDLLGREDAGDGVLRQVAPFLAPRRAFPQPVHDHHLGAARREGGDQVGPDETGAAGDQIHRRMRSPARTDFVPAAGV